MAACSGEAPSGQVIARVDDTDVTARELQHEQRVQSAVPDAPKLDRPALVERVVTRKILAEEARRKGLALDPHYHFAMRKAREDLLVDALRRDLLDTLPQASDRDVRDYMARHPWRFAERELIELRLAQDRDTPSNVVDTAVYAERPERALLNAGPGGEIALNGRKWIVEGRTAVPFGGDKARQWARVEIRQRRVDAITENIVRRARARGRLQYQSGYGPSARRARED